MRKITLLILLAGLSQLVKAQQTYWAPGVPTSSTSFSPTWRYNGTDSLANFYMSNGSRWSLFYSAAQSNARYLKKSDSTKFLRLNSWSNQTVNATIYQTANNQTLVAYTWNTVFIPGTYTGGTFFQNSFKGNQLFTGNATVTGIFSTNRFSTLSDTAYSSHNFGWQYADSIGRHTIMKLWGGTGNLILGALGDTSQTGMTRAHSQKIMGDIYLPNYATASGTPVTGAAFAADGKLVPSGTSPGSVTSIIPGIGFVNHTPITTSGTIDNDTTALQTVLNFFPKGDTRYLKLSGGTLTGSAEITGSGNFGVTNGSNSAALDASGITMYNSQPGSSFLNRNSLNYYDGTYTKIINYTPKSALTDNDTVTFQDKTGTVALLGDSSHFVTPYSLLHGSNTYYGNNTHLGADAFAYINMSGGQTNTNLWYYPQMSTPPAPTSGAKLYANNSNQLAVIQSDGTAGTLALTSNLTQFNIIDEFIVGGQSNAKGHAPVSTQPKMPAGVVYVLDSLRNWYNDTTQSTSMLTDTTNGFSASFAIHWYNKTGHKVLFVPIAVGGSAQCAAADNGNNNWDNTGTGTLVTQGLAQIAAAETAAAAHGFTVVRHGVLWLQGERDAAAITSATTDSTTYKNAYINMVGRFRAALGLTLPFYVFRIAGTGTGYTQVRTVQTEFPNIDPYSKLVFGDGLAFTTTNGYLNTDGIHWTQTGYNLAGRVGAGNIFNTIPLLSTGHFNLNQVWYTNSSGNMAQSSNFLYDGNKVDIHAPDGVEGFVVRDQSNTQSKFSVNVKTSAVSLIGQSQGSGVGIGGLTLIGVVHNDAASRDGVIINASLDSTGTTAVTNANLLAVENGGVNKFQLLTGGTMIWNGYTTNGGLIYTNSSGSVLQSGALTGVMIGNGASAPTATSILTGTNGGTGVNNSSKTITIGGNFKTLGAFIIDGAAQATLSSGTIAVTITGLTSSSVATISEQSGSGNSLTVRYKAACTTNTLTITALTAADATNTSDNSVVQYIAVN